MKMPDAGIIAPRCLRWLLLDWRFGGSIPLLPAVPPSLT